MQKRQNVLPVFGIFLVLSLFVFFILGKVTFFSSPLFALQGGIFQLIHVPSNLFADKKTNNLEAKNQDLMAQLAKLQQLEQDNAALRDQFQTTTIPAQHLVPAEVIGDPQFIPGVSNPEVLILNKGKADGVVVGDTVVYKTNLIGSITQITNHASLVTLASNKATSFTAKTSVTNAQGVLNGQGNGVMVLGNVVLAEKLQVEDTVVTGGSQDISGKGIPPGLIVGKIISVDKNPSSLYQSASVQSLVDVAKLSTVFVMTTN